MSLTVDGSDRLSIMAMLNRHLDGWLICNGGFDQRGKRRMVFADNEDGTSILPEVGGAKK